jgi:hypothetical protein
MPQSFCGPPTQLPAMHVSFTVQNTPSSHVPPSAIGTISHCVVAALHCASWQSGVAMVAQSMGHADGDPPEPPVPPTPVVLLVELGPLLSSSVSLLVVPAHAPARAK